LGLKATVSGPGQGGVVAHHIRIFFEKGFVQRAGLLGEERAAKRWGDILTHTKYSGLVLREAWTVKEGKPSNTTVKNNNYRREERIFSGGLKTGQEVLREGTVRGIGCGC